MLSIRTRVRCKYYLLDYRVSETRGGREEGHSGKRNYEIIFSGETFRENLKKKSILRKKKEIMNMKALEKKKYGNIIN